MMGDVFEHLFHLLKVFWYQEGLHTKIEPVLLSLTHAMIIDYCKEYFNGIKQIQYALSSSLNRRSAKQGNEGSISCKLFLTEIVFQYVAMKSGKTISDCNNNKKKKILCLSINEYGFHQENPFL